MALNIIVKSSPDEKARWKTSVNKECLRHYYGRECRDGVRMKLPKTVKSKQVIKELYAER